MRNPSKQLQNKWYERLRETGFDDIEQANGSLRATGPRMNDLHTAKAYTRQVFDIYKRYYEVAAQLISSESVPASSLITQLPKATQAIIRAMHADGWSNRAIEREIGVSRYLIGRIVQAFAKQIREEILNGTQETEAG